MAARHAVFAGVARDPTVSIRVVRGLAEHVEQAGVSRARFLRAAGLEADQLAATEARLPLSEVYRICEVALGLTADPAFGLHWGGRLQGSAFNPVSHLIAHSASLRQGFEALGQFARLLSDAPGFELLEQDDTVTVRCRSVTGRSSLMQRFTAEVTVTSFFSIVRSFSVHARPERVSFDHAAPAYHAEYPRIFEQAVRFEQPFTEIVFDRALLDAPSPHKDEGVHEALRALAERSIMRLTQHAPYALRVRDALVQGGPQRMDMGTVARALGISVRSLRRRLASEDRSFHEVESDALAIIAKHLLRDQQRTIQETAYEMGFSDTTTFHRAFKRWTGTTPGAHQDRPGNENPGREAAPRTRPSRNHSEHDD
jgi:AraC-like DNA-binding protein